MRGKDGRVSYKQRSAATEEGEDGDASQKMLNIQVCYATASPSTSTLIIDTAGINDSNHTKRE